MTRMQTQTHTQSTNRVTNHSSTPNLDRAIDATPLGKITAALEKRKEGIEHLLPDFMKGQGDRCIARARQYWARSSRKLQGCTEASFVGCVLAAAELGFAIDGKLCYAVPFPTRVPGEKDRWEDKAQLIVRYVGLIAVAKRGGLIQDCWARLIFPEDDFSVREENGKVQYHWQPDLGIQRDMAESAIGVMSIATHRDGWFRVDYMSMADVYRIRDRSPSFKGKGGSSPWTTDVGEMCKKTGIRRLLKTFDDDPGLLRAMSLSQEDDPDEETAETVVVPAYTQPRREEELPLSEDDNTVPFSPPTRDEIAEAEHEQTTEPTSANLPPTELASDLIADLDAKLTGKAAREGLPIISRWQKDVDSLKESQKLNVDEHLHLYEYGMKQRDRYAKQMTLSPGHP